MLQSLQPVANLVARICLAAIFVISGAGKIGNFEGMQGYMESGGVPGILLPLVILLEVAGGLAILVGWQTRVAALLLAGFTVLAAVLYHADFSQQIQFVLFLKNIAITGGLLLLFVHGAGSYSLKKD